MTQYVTHYNISSIHEESDQGVRDAVPSFNQSAQALFADQYRKNLVYRNFCNALGCSVQSVDHWKKIPSLPTDAFKLEHFPIISFPQNLIEYTFTTSGTTSETKGNHYLPSLETYEKSITLCWEELELPLPKKAFFLTAKPCEAKHSSLSHMMGVLAASYASEAHWLVNADGTINSNMLQKAASGSQPVAILGTALAFLHLFENLSASINLPKGSWAMETGGYKGTQRQLEKTELYDLFTAKLNIPQDSVINEYSMTELSSQFYTHGIGNSHQGPSWTRIRVIDPITNSDAEEGQAGHLVIYDLANCHSVMAIRTQDIAIATGDNSFILLGRDPSALPRGCSRASDAALRS
ncbi:MAG: hypothetical protein ACSHX0_10965 [Akkermansiaceae bacterium]